MKQFIRVIGIDDGFFVAKTKQKTILVGVVYRLDKRIEGIVSEKITVDSLDCTKKIIKMIKETKFASQVSLILLDGINFAGFNIVNLNLLHKKTNLPIIVVFRKKPNMHKIARALSRFKDKEKRMSLIKKAGKIYCFKNIFFQCFAIEQKKARTILKKTIVFSNLPEPVRLAHLVASGITLGESTHP